MTNTTRLTPQGQDRKKPKESRDEGFRKRKDICDEIQQRGMIRPRTNHYR